MSQKLLRLGVKMTTRNIVFLYEKQSCSNCKHLEHDGMFGIFCGVGGNNKNYNCPKYEEEVLND